MRSTTRSSGEGLSIADNENESSCDSNPYAYPYFHSNGTSPLVYDLVVKFGSRWNLVATNSDSVVGELKQLVKKIQFRCYAQPAESSWTDSCGDTALHRICQIARFPSSSNVSTLSLTSLLLDVVDALIEAYPGSATTACNNWRETPLHQFVAHCGFPNHCDKEETLLADAPENHILDLLKLLSRDKACSIQNCWGALPLHDACELSGCEIDAQAPSSPLHTWMKEQHVLMVDWLLYQNPEAVTSMDHAKHTPLHRALSSLKCSPVTVTTLLSRSDDKRGVEATLWKHYGSPHNRNVVSSKDPQGAAQSLGILWDITCVVLLQNKGDHTRLVHAAVSMKDCPPCVVDLAVQLHPKQLLEKDEDGFTPLALSIIHHGLEGAVHIVLRANPGAASIPNSQGRLPLVMALESHYSWEPTTKSLFVAEPRAVSTQDPTTLLYPFAVAAVEETRDEADQLSTIYELLRADPSVLTLHS